MKLTMWKIGRVIALCVGFSLFAGHASHSQAQIGNIEARIQSIVADVNRQTDAATRIEVAASLSSFIQIQERGALDNLSEKSIDEISSLLGDKLDTVKYWSAKALGTIGPPARSAVPALERAEKHVEFAYEDHPVLGKLGVSSSAVSEIRDALKKIRNQ